MTNEDAVERIKILKAFTGYDKDSQMVTELHEALDMAIKALEQQPSDDILDKIRVEIERKAHSGQWSDATIYGMLKAVAIIDKYRKGGAK